METKTENSTLLKRNDENESIDRTGDTTVTLNYEISHFTLVFYQQILALYLTHFLELKFSILLNISMIFMCFGGLLLFAIANELELENKANSTNNNNAENACQSSKNENKNDSNKKEKKANIGKCQLFGKNICVFSYFVTLLCLVGLIISQHSIAGNLSSDYLIIYYSFNTSFVGEFGFIRFSWFFACLTWILENLGVWLRYYNYGGNSNETIISDATESVNFCVQFEGHVALFEVFFINMAVISLRILFCYVIYAKEKSYCRAFFKFLNKIHNIQKHHKDTYKDNLVQLALPMMSLH